MRIAIVGAQGTGKTTLLNKIKESSLLDDSYVFIDEIVRKLVKEKNIKINDEGDYESQLLIFQAHQSNAMKYSNMVTDRSCIDAQAYTLYNHMRGCFTEKEVNIFSDIFSNTLKLYGKIFYIPVEFDIYDDNFRSTDKEFQQDISTIMEYILENESVDFVKLSGSVEERLSTFKNNIPKPPVDFQNKDNLKVLWLNPKT